MLVVGWVGMCDFLKAYQPSAALVRVFYQWGMNAAGVKQHIKIHLIVLRIRIRVISMNPN